MKLAEELARTCRESYVSSPIRLGPEVFHFENDSEAKNKLEFKLQPKAFRSKNDSHYLLRPEAIEGFFYLWRLTANEVVSTPIQYEETL